MRSTQPFIFCFLPPAQKKPPVARTIGFSVSASVYIIKIPCFSVFVALEMHWGLAPLDFQFAFLFTFSKLVCLIGFPVSVMGLQNTKWSVFVLTLDCNISTYCYYAGEEMQTPMQRSCEKSLEVFNFRLLHRKLRCKRFCNSGYF